MVKKLIDNLTETDKMIYKQYISTLKYCSKSLSLRNDLLFFLYSMHSTGPRSKEYPWYEIFPTFMYNVIVTLSSIFDQDIKSIR